MKALENAVELSNVSYVYPNVEKAALSKINLTLEKGKFIVIMGATGSGKSTFTLCLNGLIPQLLEGKLTGEVKVLGRDVSQTAVQSLSKVIGVVLQDPETQIIGRTVEEDTSFGPRNLMLPLEDIKQRVSHILEKVRLNGYSQRLTDELSGGEKQRLAIAGVLVMEPQILVLDEPTSELDPLGRTEIYEILEGLRKTKDLTIILVEHSSEELINKADEIIVLQEGMIAWKGIPANLFRNIPLLRQFGIKPLPVSLLGWDLFERGLITFDEIPMDLPSAEELLRTFFSKTRLKGKRNYANKGQYTINREIVIDIQDLCYGYSHDHTTLKNINLKVYRGEFVAIIGQNGAGKTTLAKHLNGLLKPSEGNVIVEGINTKEVSISYLSRTVGYVFQNPDHQIFSISVEKELEYGLKNAGYKTLEIIERVNEVLEYTGLKQFRDVHPFTLGKGERQWIAVASILALKPKILIIDEPTTGSDWNGVQAIMALIEQLHRDGTTIIMITHDMDLVAQYAERVVVMKNGQILMDDSPREVFSDEAILASSAVVPPQLCRLSRHLNDILCQQIFLKVAEFTGLFESDVESE